ncbi:hypothetical protein TNCV_3502701 [Trichonephila clavipes]|uniref:Uncharacterized protein n=1 Tax=Trichonephila clavipes TaxID=2585209 RepID=A0A8X6V7P3_TRICX|nr:hypothetical protein TNCV_3502701 [Trichonephila clavipes]
MEERFAFHFPVTSSVIRSGRPSSAAAVAMAVEQSMSTVAAHGESSAREVSGQTRVSYGSVWRALRINLRQYHYKLQHNPRTETS